jgi:death-on-curing protein
VSDHAWRWVREDSVLAIHAAQIAEHGGLSGIRDLALVQSALARPRNLVAYGNPDEAALAAAYAYGLARSHGFSDGNKRTAFVVALVFLLANGFEMTASDVDSVTTMLAVASGQMTEDALAKWFGRNEDALAKWFGRNIEPI